ncbi:MAG: aldose 1-epimerase [Flavobacteriaceae bacterium]|nr:aldose 1-epimerase [Flavobacteriaceae bacterium]
MNTEVVLVSPDNHSIVKIAKGELVGYQKSGEELIHQIGFSGWAHSDTEMFPIIGPTVSNNYRVSTPKGICIQDQHGVLRELDYTLIENNNTTCNYQKSYTANTLVKNSNYPHRSTETEVFWSYNFIFYKSFELTNTHLKIDFEISAEEGMPFMFGYHPAFKLAGNNVEICESKTQQVNLQRILEGGSIAYPFLNTNEIQLIKEQGFNIHIKTEGFQHFMLWTEVSNMLCIEPITNYPYKGTKELTKDFFNLATGKELFSVIITPF